MILGRVLQKASGTEAETGELHGPGGDRVGAVQRRGHRRGGKVPCERDRSQQHDGDYR